LQVDPRIFLNFEIGPYKISKIANWVFLNDKLAPQTFSKLQFDPSKFLKYYNWQKKLEFIKVAQQ